MTLLDKLSNNKANLLTIIIPLILYLCLTLPLSDWIVDDAGISFVYARNLANGHGLVTQPGVEPIEGYSNFLWLLIMAPFFIVNIFDPYVVPKIISLIFIGVTFYNIHKSIGYFKNGNNIVSFLVLCCLSINTSFLVWTCSGLENPLFVALITTLFLEQLKFISDNRTNTKTAIISALLVLAIGLTRPDGIVYAIVFPSIIIIKKLTKTPIILKEVFKPISINILFVVVGYSVFTIFRYLYFGDIMPNTYYAKGGPSVNILIPAMTLQEPYLSRFLQLIVSIVGTKIRFFILAFIIAMSTIYLYRREKLSPFITLLLFTFLSGFTFIIMPSDWMGEFRFATPFFIFFYTLVFTLISFILKSFLKKLSLQIIISIAASMVIFGITIKVHSPRLSYFYDHPIVSFKRIGIQYGQLFNKYAEKLGLENGSVLLPDIGGTLYYCNLRVYDLGRLCDKVITRTLRRKQKEFYNYVFDTIKPTFIHIHGNWTFIANLDADERFRSDYVAIEEYQDKWIEKYHHKTMMSGDYVRIDALKDINKDLELLKKQ